MTKYIYEMHKCTVENCPSVFDDPAELATHQQFWHNQFEVQIGLVTIENQTTINNLMRDIGRQNVALIKDGYFYKAEEYSYYYGLNTSQMGRHMLGVSGKADARSIDIFIATAIPDLLAKIGDLQNRGTLDQKCLADPCSYMAHPSRALHTVGFCIQVGAEFNQPQPEENWQCIASYPIFSGGNSYDRLGDLARWYLKMIDCPFYEHTYGDRDDDGNLIWVPGLGPLIKEYFEICQRFAHFGEEFNWWDRDILNQISHEERQLFYLNSLFQLVNFLRINPINIIHSYERGVARSTIEKSVLLLNTTPHRIQNMILNNFVDPSFFTTTFHEYMTKLIKNNQSLEPRINAQKENQNVRLESDDFLNKLRAFTSPDANIFVQLDPQQAQQNNVPVEPFDPGVLNM